MTGDNLIAQVGYVGTLTIHQHTRYNYNYGLPGGGAASQPLYAAFKNSNTETIVEPFEHMNYQSLQAQIQKRFSDGLQFFAGYTWSKWMGTCCDDRGDGAPEIPIPQYWQLNYAVMPNDRTNNLQISGIYELPFGTGKEHLTTGVGAAIAGGWQTNAVFSAYSGLPFSVSSPLTRCQSQRADRVKAQVAIHGPHGLASPYFDTSAFAAVTTARFGTAGYDSLQGRDSSIWISMCSALSGARSG